MYANYCFHASFSSELQTELQNAGCLLWLGGGEITVPPLEWIITLMTGKFKVVNSDISSVSI